MIATYGIGIKKFDCEGRFVITDHDDFLLYNIYIPNGGSGDERHNFKQDFLKRLSMHLKEIIKSGRQVVVVGDYNVAHKDIDVYDPKKLGNHSGFLPEERKWFSHFLELGFVDAFRYFHPDLPQQYTWWDYRTNARVGNRGWRIDYICLTEALTSRLQSCEILADVEGSDHCPVVLKM